MIFFDQKLTFFHSDVCPIVGSIQKCNALHLKWQRFHFFSNTCNIIYVLFINPFIQRNRNIMLYFNSGILLISLKYPYIQCLMIIHLTHYNYFHSPSCLRKNVSKWGIMLQPYYHIIIIIYRNLCFHFLIICHNYYATVLFAFV